MNLINFKSALVILILSLGIFCSLHSQKKTHDVWEHTEIGSITIYFSLEEALKTPEKIRGLQLRDLGLNELPKEISKLKNLEYLRVHHNNLTTIPDFIISLPKLRVLEIGGNRLGNVTEEIGKMTNLEHLGLKANGLTKIPESIGKLTKLKTLNLDFNYLTSLPESIKNLINLEDLSLMRNDSFTRAELEKVKKLLPKQCFVR